MEEKRNDLRKLSPLEEARFLEYMRAIEGEGPQTTLMELITGDGVQVPSPDELNDEQLSVKLWEVIHAIHNPQSWCTSLQHGPSERPRAVHETVQRNSGGRISNRAEGLSARGRD